MSVRRQLDNLAGKRADDLAAALRALGVPCRVEAREALGVVVIAPGERAFEQPAMRQEALNLARQHGFTHLAIEYGPVEPAGG